MIERVNLAIQQKCRLDASAPVLVGVSGGPDSLCLLDILCRLGYPVIVAHLDHVLRPESAAEALSVKHKAEILGVDCLMHREDAGEYARDHQLSLEEAARVVRYRFLFEKAVQCGAQAVVVGHNADDQVETVLMHLMRGSGLAGLRGMSYRSLPNSWSEELALVRPLLGIWREEILSYVEERNLDPVIDSSNLDTRYYRNRLRHELIPILEGYNPQVKRHFWNMALTLADDYDVLEAEVEAGWQACVREQGQGYVGFSMHELKLLPVGVQRHLVRRAIHRLRPDVRDIDFGAVQRFLEFFQSPPRSGRCDLLGGLRLWLEGEILWLAEREAEFQIGNFPQLEIDQAAHLPVPGMLSFREGWRLRAEYEGHVEEARTFALENTDPYRAWLDASDLSHPLLIRSRHAGDRFRPLGMGGHSIKISDFMVNEKMPRRARDNWPLVVSGEDIVWVPGYRLAHPFRVRKNTEKIVRLNLVVRHTE
jgi:tRNA(Ile)-lysidine synthase